MEGNVTTRQGQRQLNARSFITGEVSVSLEAPHHFAPSVENCEIVVQIIHHTSRRSISRRVVITDRHGTEVKRWNMSPLERGHGDGEYQLSWDGKDTNNEYVSPQNSPYTVTLQMGALRRRIQTRVEIASLSLWTREHPKVYMNDPTRRAPVVATVFLRKSDDTHVQTRVPLPVHWTCTPGSGNARKTDSFQIPSSGGRYQVPGGPAINVPGGVYLGKAGDANAVYWEQHRQCPLQAGSSTLLCHTPTIVTEGNDRGKAKVYFKPSGVGGDTFILKAAVLASNGTTELIRREINLEVWRKLSFVPYQMHGINTIRRYGSRRRIRRFFDSAFVDYDLGDIQRLDRQFAVNYVCLWSGSGEKSKSEWSGKQSSETYTASEAASAIQRKAQGWQNRINRAGISSMNAWVRAASIPAGAFVAIRWFHPKLVDTSLGTRIRRDGATNEWPNATRVSYRSRNMDPDGQWNNTIGMTASHPSGNGDVVFLYYGDSVASTIDSIAHEAGHASSAQFPRAPFGTGDHSSSPGLMDPDGSRSPFTAQEKRILRGLRR